MEKIQPLFSKIEINFKSIGADISHSGFLKKLIQKYCNPEIQKIEKKDFLIESFKNSFLFIKGSHASLIFHFFDSLKLFFLVDSIHLFVDDIMSSFVGFQMNEKVYEKIKTFLTTFDENQIPFSLGFDSVLDVFPVENLNIVYRYSRKVFDYLKHFYDFSINFRHNINDSNVTFESFDLFKEFILKENKKPSEIHPERYMIDDIKCEHDADGEVIEIGVEFGDLFEAVKESIDDAIRKKFKNNEIAVFIHHRLIKNNDFTGHIEDRFKNERADLSFILNFIKMQSFDGAFDAITRSIHPIANDFFNKINKIYSNKCVIQMVTDLQELLNSDEKGIRSIYSAEYKRVICVDINGTILRDNSKKDLRLNYYFTFSRATTYLKIIYVKNIKLSSIEHLNVISNLKANERKNYIEEKNNSLQSLISFLRMLELEYYSEDYLNSINTDFSEYLCSVDLLFGNLIPISVDEDENNLYKSISVLLIGNCEIYSVIKLGVFFILIKYEKYFTNILKDMKSEYSFEQLIEKVNDIDCNDYILLAISILLEKPLNLFVFDESNNQLSYSEKFFIESIHETKPALYLAKRACLFVPFLLKIILK